MQNRKMQNKSCIISTILKKHMRFIAINVLIFRNLFELQEKQIVVFWLIVLAPLNAAL